MLMLSELTGSLYQVDVPCSCGHSFALDGEEAGLQLTCVQGSDPSGQPKSWLEELTSICTHRPPMLRVQLEVEAKTVLLLGTLPWARPV